MRLTTLFFVFFALAGIGAAQDTNFSAGPQYLVTGSSPMFLRSIATPSMSLEPSLPGLPSLPQMDR